MKGNIVKQRISGVSGFFGDRLWSYELGSMPTFRRLAVQALKVLYLTFRNYCKDGCGLQASALTYITMVSLVPVLAIMFAFSKGIGMQKVLYDSIGVERVMVVKGDRESDIPPVFDFRVKKRSEKTREETLIAQLPESMQQVSIQILKYVDNTNFAAMGLVGSVMLIFSVVLSIAKLETCFNQIWGVSVARSFLRKVSEYLIVLIVVPILFLIVTSANSLLMSDGIIGLLSSYFGDVAYIMIYVCKAVTAGMLLLFFAFIYGFLPHTKVKVSSGLVAGIVAGILWLVVLYLYLKMQIGLAKFNKIYGTFAALPFFLAVMYANWCIILLGGEFSYALQYHRMMRIEKMAKPMPAGGCMILGQLAMFEACKAYAGPEHSWNPEAYGVREAIPLRQLQYAVYVLVQAKLLVQISSQLDVDLFVPGCPPDTITPATVEEAFRSSGKNDVGQYMDMMPEGLRDIIRRNYRDFLGELRQTDFETLVAQQRKTAGQDA